MKMFNRMAILLILMILITACNNTKGPVTAEEINQFITDSEKVYTLLETANQENRELSSDEQSDFMEFTSKYDKESYFQKRTDDPSISLVVTNSSLMELMLGKEDELSKQNFKDYKSDFLEELNAVKDGINANKEK